MKTCLPEGLPRPVPAPDGLDAPYWQAAQHGRLRIQRCARCRGWQWGPEWICHRCLSFEMTWEDVEGRGEIFSWERTWHVAHPALAGHVPYVTVIVSLPQADGVRLVGNLLGDPRETVEIGAKVEAVFEHHPSADPPYTLVQWQRG